MYNLQIFNKDFIFGYSTVILDILSLISIICAIYIIVSVNPIISVLYLIGLFITIASYLLIIGLNFIGLSYLLIYIGAVSILFIFILMLINIRISELISNSRNSIPLVAIITIILNNVLYNSINTFANKNIRNNIFNVDYNYLLSKSMFTNELLVTNVSWDNSIIEFDNVASLGNIIYTNYSIWLIIVSIILLLAMIGAILITIKQHRPI